jgi:hypothetical protein
MRGRWERFCMVVITENRSEEALFRTMISALDGHS